MSEHKDRIRKRVVVIGGGLAGLSAAEAIAESYPDQFQVTVLEAKKTVGGRAGSFVDPSTGETVDYCQHVAMGCCENLIELLRRRGLADQFNRYSELLFLHPEHPASRFVPSRRLPAPLHLWNAFASLRFLTRRQHREVRRALFHLFRTRSEKLMGYTAIDWLRSAGQDPSTIRDFWEVILVSALGEQPDVVSMAAARKVFVDGFAGAVGASDVLVPRRPLGDLFGRQLRQAIEALGVTVLTNQPAKSLVTEPNLAIRIQDGVLLPADHVVVAVPWHSVQTVVPGELVPEVATFSSFPSSPISGLHLWFDRQFTDQQHAVMVGTVSQWMFRQPWENDPTIDHDRVESRRDRVESSRGFYYQIVISASHAARRMARDELVRTVVGEIRNAFPAAREAKLLHSRIVTDPHSVFSIQPQVEAARPCAETSQPWLHLAGDWIATGWPATMEGAVISGRMAASSLLAREGLNRPPIKDGLPRGWLARLLIR